MRNPVLVNVVSPDEKGQRVLRAVVLDLHPDNIVRIINQKNNETSIILREDGTLYTLAVPFIEFLKLYKQMRPIDLRYEHEVMAYLKDNFSVKGKNDD